MFVQKSTLLLALASVAKIAASNPMQPRQLAKAAKESKGTKSPKGEKDPDDPETDDGLVGNDPPGNGPPGSSSGYKIGGWVGDEDWGVQIPFANLDFLNYGYLTCIQTLRNGPCNQPGMRAASNGPPTGTNGAKDVKFTIGGDGCNTAGWNPNTVVSAVKSYGWKGVDVDNECSMTSSQMNAQFQAANNGDVTSMFSVLGPDQLNGVSINPGPDYFATLTFWGTEWCSVSSPASGCASIDGGYEKQIPQFIQGVLGFGMPSSSVLLGLHALGINSATVQFWCQQIITNNLGGVMVSFINKMDPSLFQELESCLVAPSPSGCKPYYVEADDTCWQIGQDQCGDGNDWSTELFQDSSCSTPMTDSACSSMQVGQAVYSNCNAPPPTPTNCKPYSVEADDTCWQIGQDQCGDGNDWSTELFQDSSCDVPMTDSACSSMQVGQAVYSNCNAPPPAPTNCKEYTVESNDTCWQIGQDQCGNGNNWSTELFTDASCTIPMDDSSCSAMQVGQSIYTNCN